MACKQVRVGGHEFIGHGEATTEQAAQDTAAARFVKYLVSSGLVSPTELPNMVDHLEITLDSAAVSGFLWY